MRFRVTLFFWISPPLAASLLIFKHRSTLFPMPAPDTFIGHVWTEHTWQPACLSPWMVAVLIYVACTAYRESR
jgi:hypothetical protein